MINLSVAVPPPQSVCGRAWECALVLTWEYKGRLLDDRAAYQAPSGAPYALLPSKAQIKADGSVIRRDDGKVAYTPVLKFANREANDRFSIGVVELVRRRFPEALP